MRSRKPLVAVRQADTDRCSSGTLCARDYGSARTSVGVGAWEAAPAAGKLLRDEEVVGSNPATPAL
ncbi:MAG: hypothetical protein JWR24_4403 [Actinoallomurus sp.]|jgi:hypothetical protein|nr:hypothetical protein [Actinoallomurus sp.]